MDLVHEYSDEEIAERESLQERDELADKGYTAEHDNPMPAECERCGKPFGRLRKHWHSEDEWEWSGATTIGGRWVCNDCEQAEWEDHTFDLEEAINELQEREFSALRDEAGF
jgi:hypothetical protein